MKGSQEVLGAEFGLQEFKELLTAHWVLQSLVQREAPLLYSLLTRVLTETDRGRKTVFYLVNLHSSLRYVLTAATALTTQCTIVCHINETKMKTKREREIT